MNVGTLATGILASVDQRGRVQYGEVGLDWSVHVNTWIDPATAAGMQHLRPGIAPIAETALRIPDGEAVQRVYAVGEQGGLVVIEVVNASPHAIGVGFRLIGAGELASSRPVGAVEPDGTRAFPLPHRQVLRVALGAADVDVKALPDWRAVARGWDALLDRGMRVELPEIEQWSVDAARADLLLAPPSAETFVALEDWGFDEQAAVMWGHLAGRDRRAARRRSRADGPLEEMRAALLREDGSNIALLPGFRPAWLGQSIAVHDAPLRQGRVSFAVRWHGARPALLWDAPAGTRLHVPALDPTWSSDRAVGEALLAEPPRTLLPMGQRVAAEGTTMDAPEGFS
jgi:hypothetical protein